MSVSGKMAVKREQRQAAAQIDAAVEQEIGVGRMIKPLVRGGKGFVGEGRDGLRVAAGDEAVRRIREQRARQRVGKQCVGVGERAVHRVKHDGDTFFLYVLLYSLERTFVEGLRGDSLWIIKPSAAGMTDGVRVSQALSFLLFVGVLAFFIIRAVREKKEGRLMWPKPIAVCECANEAGAKCECECECCKAEDNAAEESTEADAEDKEETTQTNDDNTENEEGEGKE